MKTILQEEFDKVKEMIIEFEEVKQGTSATISLSQGDTYTMFVAIVQKEDVPGSKTPRYRFKKEIK